MADESRKRVVLLGRPGVTPVSVGDDLRVITSVSGDNRVEINERWREAVESGADIIEWRVDGLVSPEAETHGLKMRDHYRVPVVVTLRTKPEGGRFPRRHNDAEYRRLILQAAHWADAVDVEASMPEAEALLPEVRDLGALVVASRHVLEGEPTEQLVREALLEVDELKPDIVKLAWDVKNPQEAAVIEQAQQWALENISVPTIVIGMGAEGASTRLADSAKAGAFVFAHAGYPSAKGQPHISEVR